MILLDGQASVNDLAADRGLAYGDGLFETIPLYDGKLLNWQAHCTRLQHGCALFGIACPDDRVLWRECASISAQRRHAVLKIIITRGSGGRGYRAPYTSRARRIVSVHDWPADLDTGAKAGVRTWICAHRLGHNPVLAGIKHLNRLDQVIASREWPDPEMFEGLMFDIEDQLIEGTRSNLFLVHADTLATPALAKCGVDGIVRQAVIAAARGLQLPLAITALRRADLAAADEVFICNSVIGVRAIAEVAGLRHFTPGPVTARLAGLLRDAGQIP